MATEVTQIKVTLPNPLLNYLTSKAGKFGLTVSAYVKYLIINDVKDMEFQVYRKGKRTRRVGIKGL